MFLFSFYTLQPPVLNTRGRRPRESAPLKNQGSVTGGTEASTFHSEQDSALCTIVLQMGRRCQVEKKLQHSLFNTASLYFLPLSFQEPRKRSRRVVLLSCEGWRWLFELRKMRSGQREKRDRTTASLRLRSSGLIYLGWIFGECSSSIVCSRLVSPDAAAALVLQ